MAILSQPSSSKDASSPYLSCQAWHSHLCDDSYQLAELHSNTRLSCVLACRPATVTLMILNSEGIPLDYDLTARGMSQAQELASHLAKQHSPRLDMIFSSPYTRRALLSSASITSSNKTLDSRQMHTNGQRRGTSYRPPYPTRRGFTVSLVL